MKRERRSLLPAVLLAAGTLAATAVSVWGPWALAGPAVMAVTVVATGAVRGRLAADAIMGGAVLAAGAIVAAVDPSAVVMMMPILSACAATTLIAKRRCAAAA